MTPHASARPPEATGGDGSGGSAVEAAAAQSKPGKRKKSRPPPPPSMEEAAQSKPAKRKKKAASSSAAAGSATPSPPSDGSGDGQQQRGKPRVVWSEELHDMFLKAYNILGEDAVPKKILALMNVDGITRENVASHLQKYRLSLKQEEKLIPDNEGELEASSSQTPLPTTPPQAQAQEPAPSSLHTTLPPQPQAPFAALNVSQLQVGQHHGGQQLLQTPPDCFGINATATDWLLGPGGIPMAQPTQQRFVPPPEAAAVAARRELFKEQQEAGRDANATARQAAEMANMMGYEEAEIPMAQLVMAITGGEGDGREQAAAEMGARAEDGQGPPAEPEADEMAAGPDEEGRGRGGEPAGAAASDAGSVSPPGCSIHGQYWKIDDAEVSWDFGFPWYKTG